MPEPGIDLARLNATFGLRQRLRFELSTLGGPVAVLETNGARAVVALFGAQVLDWRPADHQPALWLSPLARLGTGKAVRGGIPICWPWFGPRPAGGLGDDGVSTGGDSGAANWPQHGFARTSQWSVSGSCGDADTVSLSLRLLAIQPNGTDWPHTAELSLTIALSGTLSLSLETVNRGTAGLDLTQALHTYFLVSDIAGIELTGLDASLYHDAVAHGAALTPDSLRDTQSGAVRFAGEVDRIYPGRHDRLSLIDPGLARVLDITSSGSGSTVVWNPWSGKAEALGDLGPEQWRRMVCVETANTVYDAVRLEPGASTSLVAHYAVRRS